MNRIKAFSLTLLLLGTGAAFAQSSPEDHAAHHAPTAASAPTLAATPSVEGEVRKLDKAMGKITLKHGVIANLDMPGMTMVFRVAEPKLLDGIKQGDKVKFSADNIKGVLTVTALALTP
jgi:Cu/Ag efflux protein CusF